MSHALWMHSDCPVVAVSTAQHDPAAPASAHSVRRLLSFQRYLHSSRRLRCGSAPPHILDDDYVGQAKVSCRPPAQKPVRDGVSC